MTHRSFQSVIDRVIAMRWALGFATFALLQGLLFWAYMPAFPELRVKPSVIHVAAREISKPDTPTPVPTGTSKTAEEEKAFEDALSFLLGNIEQTGAAVRLQNEQPLHRRLSKGRYMQAYRSVSRPTKPPAMSVDHLRRFNPVVPKQCSNS